jgi:hypothetical protein
MPGATLYIAPEPLQILFYIDIRVVKTSCEKTGLILPKDSLNRKASLGCDFFHLAQQPPRRLKRKSDTGFPA